MKGEFQKKGKRELCNDTSLQPVIRSYPIRPFHVRTGVNVAHFGVIGFEVVAVVPQNTAAVVWISHHHTLFGTRVTLWSIYLVSWKMSSSSQGLSNLSSNLLTKDYSIFFYSLYPFWFVHHSNKYRCGISRTSVKIHLTLCFFSVYLHLLGRERWKITDAFSVLYYDP